jgi:hypothetical protein
LISPITTLAPRAAQAVKKPAPRPLAPPVMRIVLSLMVEESAGFEKSIAGDCMAGSNGTRPVLAVGIIYLLARTAWGRMWK